MNKVYLDWFVIQYKPNSSATAKRNLERQGVKTFMPLIEITERKHSKFVTALKPLFLVICSYLST